MNTIWIVMPILIVLMFLLGTELNKEAFINVARHPKAVVLGMVGQIILLPLIAFTLAWALNLPPVYFMGLVLIACCPGGSSSNVFSMLAKGGRLSIITFHSVEDRLVKQKFLSFSKGCTCPPDFPVCVCGNKPKAKLINRKPIVASQEELEHNLRSRSAKLRAIERL